MQHSCCFWQCPEKSRYYNAPEKKQKMFATKTATHMHTDQLMSHISAWDLRVNTVKHRYNEITREGGFYSLYPIFITKEAPKLLDIERVCAQDAAGTYHAQWNRATLRTYTVFSCAQSAPVYNPHPHVEPREKNKRISPHILRTIDRVMQPFSQGTSFRRGFDSAH